MNDPQQHQKQRVAEAALAYVDVRSTPGEGTTFFVSLPVAQPQPAEAAHEAARGEVS